MTGQIMERAGLQLDKNPFTAHPSNPDSHFESQTATQLHDDILGDNSTNWLLYNYDPNKTFDVSSANRAQAEALASKYEHLDKWGFKDPRSSLFMNLWADVLRRPRVIIVYRHFGQCQNSLLKRAAEFLVIEPEVTSDSALLWQNTHLSISAWIHYNKALINYVEENPEDCIVVSQEALLNGFNLIHEVNSRFNLMLDSNAKSGVIKSKARSQQTTYHAPDCTVLQDEADAVWEKLNALSCAPATEVPTPFIKSCPAKGKRDFNIVDFAAMPQQDDEKSIPETDSPEPITIEDLATPQILNRKVNYFLNAGDAEKMVSTFKSFKAQEHNSGQIELILGKAYKQLARYSLAREHLLQAQTQFPDHPGILNNLAQVEMADKNFPAAIGHYESVIKVQPESALMRAAYCDALLANEQLEKALAESRRGRLETQPNHILEIRHIELLMLQGLNTEAERSYYLGKLLFQNLILLGKPGEAQVVYDCSVKNSISRMPDYSSKLDKLLESISNASWQKALGDCIHSELERVFKVSNAA